MCPKSYLYIYEFRVIYISVLFQSVGTDRNRVIRTGSSVFRFSLTSIWRDLFPNTTHFHMYHVKCNIFGLMGHIWHPKTIIEYILDLSLSVSQLSMYFTQNRYVKLNLHKLTKFPFSRKGLNYFTIYMAKFIV